MDFWALRCLEEMREAEELGIPPGEHTGDHAMADTVMDFLFASQDASTASLVWMVCLMAGHPDVLAKVGSAPHTTLYASSPSLLVLQWATPFPAGLWQWPLESVPVHGAGTVCLR